MASVGPAAGGLEQEGTTIETLQSRLLQTQGRGAAERNQTRFLSLVQSPEGTWKHSGPGWIEQTLTGAAGEGVSPDRVRFAASDSYTVCRHESPQPLLLARPSPLVTDLLGSPGAAGGEMSAAEPKRMLTGGAGNMWSATRRTLIFAKVK